MRVYLDNAATTPIDPLVLEAMMPYLQEQFGNPSSIHHHGRQVRAAVEKARKQMAALLHCAPAELFFTSGGTEADNSALVSAIRSHEIKVAISSPIEHHAVLHTLEYLAKKGEITLHLLPIDTQGNISLSALEDLLQHSGKVLVSLMHANNEIGNILPWKQVADLCQTYGALFHSDAVQTAAKLPINLSEVGVHFIAGAAHKFHGPKGAGFMFIRQGVKIEPYLLGGSQERNMRGGTENVAAIMGMAKAFEIAHQNMENTHQHCQMLKDYMMKELRAAVPDVAWHGNHEEPANSMPNVLNVCLPEVEDADMLLFNLDIEGLSVSGGSACSSGSSVGSHVIQALRKAQGCGESKSPAVRFSFSKYNTTADIDFAVQKVAALYKDRLVTH